MAPAPIAGGGFGPAGLPGGAGAAGMVAAGAGPGTYIIVNTATNNRYIGIAGGVGGVAGRFLTRLATITEMGFAVATMQTIGVTWGTTTTWNTPAGGMGAFPAAAAAWPVGGVIAVPPAGGAYNVAIDGIPVNLEHLLIRFVMTQLGAGGTVSNNLLIAPYVNTTGNPIVVRLSWGAMGGLFAAGAQQAVWNPLPPGPGPHPAAAVAAATW